MRGDHALLAITTTEDDITGETKPLFSIPVQICAAIESREPSFDVAAPSGAPRKQEWVDTATGELVADEDCPRGVRVGDMFHEIPAEAIDQIKQATKITTMVALGTTTLETLPFDRQTDTHYLQSPAKGGAPKAYRLLYEALLPVTKAGKAIRPAKAVITKRTGRSRQKLCAIYADADRKCLVLADLRFASQIREPDEAILAPLTANVEAKQVDMTRKVIDKLGDGLLALDSEHDEVLALRQELIEQALAGETITAPTKVADTVAGGDLEALLEASLAQ